MCNIKKVNSKDTVYIVETNIYNKFLFAAKKRKHYRSCYDISLIDKFGENQKHNYIGKVIANFLGTEFEIFNEGKNPKHTKDMTEIRSQYAFIRFVCF